jgi:hypothetical protein
MKTYIRQLFAIGVVLACLSEPAAAQRRGGGSRGGGMRRGGGGGGGFASRGSARSSVTTRPSFSPPVNRPPANVNRPANPVVRPPNIAGGDVNFNRPINVGDVDVHHDYGRPGTGCCYYDHPVAAAAVVGTAAAVTAAAIGSTVYTLPSSCTTVVVNGFTYEQCGSAWYQPQFSGTTTTYVVVSPPQ